ncbi:pyridoxal phosphate-dependent aminotransferase [Streptomyces gibsoniae]|uniref:Aminotransferase class I/II-fold pyridoxal phosphate-dependent enzyme n=1 Tax=Streptomyces gibsoniae TaxID=3075529 RepID=A0ABU2TU32_9ACTN|nr:aminotransferase class I/II-fold pyridoxal phosphate-dependent enzyme [Streptomyces sp. DSM 41699]MDT0464465.1 aminotransferase class I/II-fold pyridoxal phosphate-dependent enzyme [Streptomyces sp. DSM 41699]
MALRPGRRLMAAAGPAHQLAHNENPFGPPAEVRAALHEAIAVTNRYPQFRPDELTGLIAGWQGLSADAVAVGQGAGGVAHDLFRAVLRPGDNVVCTAPGFDLYPMLCEMTGTHAATVDMAPGGRNDLTGLARHIDDRTRAVVLCNPDNPTGTLTGWADLSDFFARVPQDVTIVLDEAYVDFAPEFDAPAPRERLDAWPNLMILRTFSKSHGLAALRVGYALGSPDLVRRIRRHQLPFAIGQFQLAGVRAALAAQEEVKERVAQIVAERERVRAELLRRGWSVPRSHANFLWLEGAERPQLALDALTRAGIAVRHHPGRGIRLTVGDKAANDAVLSALHRV